MSPAALSAAPGSVHTSASLLVRVKARDGEAWQQLSQLYGPLIYSWARKADLQPHDALDVVQNVFLSVAADIHRFRREKPGDTFRGWLWTICRHKILDRVRERQQQPLPVGGTTADHRLQNVAADCAGDSDDASALCRLRHRALALLRDRFPDHVWQAFLRTVIHGDRPADVAEDLGIAVSTVYRARFQVLKGLREALDGL